MKDEVYYHAGKLILISAFIYVLLRAYCLSITYDEAVTYLNYATKSYIGIFTEESTANNHFINTVLIKFFTGIFGVSEFVVRIPALIGASLYLASAYSISKLLFRKHCFLASVYLLVSNALIMDFLSLARGYSLALGFFMVALYYLLKEEHNEIAALMCTLMVLSSLSFLYVYAAFILLLAYRELGDIRSLVLKAILPTGFSALFLFLVLFNTVKRMHLAGEFYFGGTTSFWQDTGRSLIVYALYDNYSNILLIEISQIIVIGLIGIGLLVAYRTREKRLLTISFMLIVVILLIHLHHALGTRFLLDRAAIFFVPLFSLFIMLAWHATSSRIANAFYSIIIILVIINFIGSINIAYTLSWNYDANTKDAINEMIYDYHAGEKTIGVTSIYYPSTSLYRLRYNLSWLKPLTMDDPDGIYDYYIISKSDHWWGPGDEYILYKYNLSYTYYPLGDCYFAKRGES